MPRSAGASTPSWIIRNVVQFLESIEAVGLMDAIEQGLFADIKRPRDMGKGLDGLRPKADGYWNPFEQYLTRELGL